MSPSPTKETTDSSDAFHSFLETFLSRLALLLPLRESFAVLPRISSRAHLTLTTTRHDDLTRVVYKTAWALENGIGRHEDEVGAAELIARCARMRHPLAMADCSLSGVDGFREDESRAVCEYQRLAEEEGVCDCYAMTRLGSCYLTGCGDLEVDHVKAEQWFLRAKTTAASGNHNNPAGVVASSFLARMRDGGGGKVGHEEEEEEKRRQVVEFYQFAAEGGHVASMYHLARVLETRRVDAVDAVRWYKAAAGSSGRHIPSMYRLARCYEDGVGVRRDLKNALRWFRKTVRSVEAEASRRDDDIPADWRDLARKAETCAVRCFAADERLLRDLVLQRYIHFDGKVAEKVRTKSTMRKVASVDQADKDNGGIKEEGKSTMRMVASVDQANKENVVAAKV